MIITSHAGHNPDGKIACGAVGLIKESTEARVINNKVIELLKSSGHTIHDVTVNDGISQSDVLNKIITKCNQIANVNLNISIHLNAGVNDLIGNGNTTGTEVLTYSALSSANPYAVAVCKRIAELGFKNRGVKHNTSLAVLKNSKAPTLLIECCFVDDADDIKKYNSDTMANAIAQGIIDVGGGVAQKLVAPSIAKWIQDANRWWYKHADGSYTKNNWEIIDGIWYYFDAEGWMVTGWQLWKDKWYFLKANGHMATGLILVNEEPFYLDGNGAMATEPVTFTPDKRGVLR